MVKVQTALMLAILSCIVLAVFSEENLFKKKKKKPSISSKELHHILLSDKNGWKSNSTIIHSCRENLHFRLEIARFYKVRVTHQLRVSFGYLVKDKSITDKQIQNREHKKGKKIRDRIKRRIHKDHKLVTMNSPKVKSGDPAKFRFSAKVWIPTKSHKKCFLTGYFEGRVAVSKKDVIRGKIHLKFNDCGCDEFDEQEIDIKSIGLIKIGSASHSGGHDGGDGDNGDDGDDSGDDGDDGGDDGDSGDGGDDDGDSGDGGDGGNDGGDGGDEDEDGWDDEGDEGMEEDEGDLEEDEEEGEYEDE